MKALNNRLSIWLSQQWFSVFILLISIFCTLAFTVITLYLAKIKEEARFENSVSSTQKTIESRLDTYSALIKAEAGLFLASKEVDVDEFHVFTQLLELETRFPGIKNVGYVARLTADNRELVLNQVKAKKPNFFLSENTGQPQFIGIFIEPHEINQDFKNEELFGTDFYQIPAYREAMIQARDSGQPTLTQKIQLALSDKDTNQAETQIGFALFIPIYTTPETPTTTDQRQNLLIGYTFGFLQAEALFADIKAKSPQSDIDLLIYDGTTHSAENLIYQSNSDQNSQFFSSLPQYSDSEIINFAGKSLNAVFVSNSNFNYSLERSTYPYYLTVGLIISFLIFALSRLHSKSIYDSQKAHAELLSSQEALRRSSIRYKTLAENASDLVTVIDSLGTILYASPSHEEIFGTNPDDLLGASVLPYIHPDDFDTFQEKLAIMSGGGREQAVFRVQRQNDGSYISLEGVGAGLMDDEGEMTGVLLISRDITQRQEIDRRKDEFISIASHELKTPITSLKAYTQYLEQYFANKQDQVSTELLGKMDRQLLKLSRLIRDLLDVSRIESGRLDIQITKFDLKDVILEVLETLSMMGQTQRIKLNKITSTKIEADRDRIAQVITNLLANAMKYSSNKKEIVVSQKKTKKAVTICVQDFGLGIPRSKQSQVFDRFYRVEGPKQETFAGFGLGLYIAKEIIEKHQGKIWVKSQLGQGSTFCFTIPLQNLAKVEKQ